MGLLDKTLKNILVIRPDAIGDCILITPAISLLKEKYPGARITVLSRSYTRDIFTSNPDIDEVIDDWFSEKKVNSIRDFIRYVKFIKSKKFDCSIHFYNEIPYALLAFLARIRTRIGDRSKPLISPFYNKKSNCRWNDLTLHEVEHNILLLKGLGIELPNTPPPMKLCPSERIKDKMFLYYNIKPFTFVAGIHIGTGKGNKSWLPERYAAVIDYLITNYNAAIVLTGSKKELPYSNILLRHIPKQSLGKIINIVDKTSLSELIAITSRFNLFVGVDTGPLHISAALKIPTVAIFPTKFVKPSEWGPYQTRHVIVRKASKCSQKCSPQNCPFDDCLKEITSHDVIEGINALFNNHGNNTYEEAKKDWFLKSANIFTNRQDVLNELKASGYNAVDIGLAISFQKLANQMVREDINIIHWIGHELPISLRIAKMVATPKLPISPLLIHEKVRANISSKILIDFYKGEFKK